jgi:hypothetical protein
VQFQALADNIVNILPKELHIENKNGRTDKLAANAVANNFFKKILIRNKNF